MQGSERVENSPPKRPHKAGDLRSLRAKLWWALLHAEFVMVNAEEATTRLKAVHAISQTALSYLKLQEVLDLQSRVEALEAMMMEVNARHEG